MRRNVAMLAAVAMVVGVLALAFSGGDAYARGKGNPLPQGIVYVTGQDLFYDTHVPVSALPMHGVFQELRPGAGPGGASETDYGPGDPGYVGGRWWVDANGNGEMDVDDTYFLCPLQGPGRPMP